MINQIFFIGFAFRHWKGQSIDQCYFYISGTLVKSLINNKL